MGEGEKNDDKREILERMRKKGDRTNWKQKEKSGRYTVIQEEIFKCGKRLSIFLVSNNTDCFLS